MKLVKTLLILFTFLMVSSCNKDDDQNPIDKLPPITQTGEQTFGCLIDGKAFVADSFGSGRPSAFYQYVGGAYTLSIKGSKHINSDPIKSISIAALDVEVSEVGTYQLINEDSGNFFGKYLIDGGSELRAVTTDQNPDMLTITRFDKDGEYIISGTFSFTVKDNDGNYIKITDGRFDIKYTN